MFQTVISRLTTSQLILSNIHLGAKYCFINIKLKPYLLGRRNGYYILNISFTYFQFKIITKLLIRLFTSRQKILVLKDLDVYNLILSLNYKNIYFYNKKWIGGTLTNFRIIRKSKKFIDENITYNSLGSLNYMPSLFFFFNTYISRWALWEAYNLDIPIAGIINTDSPFFEIINYPIIGNNKSFEATYLYINILRYAYIQSIQKEKLDILRLTRV